MKSFNTLKELVNYIPNCLVCGKQMMIIIKGHILPNSQNRFNGYYTRLIVNNNQIVSRNKKHNITVNLDTNEFIDGKEVIYNLKQNWIYLNKTCRTCRFDISTVYRSGQQGDKNYFPTFLLDSETISYTWKNGKQIYIVKYHNIGVSVLSDSVTQISVNNKWLPSIPFDFSKFSKLSQLNNRISTLLVFH